MSVSYLHQTKMSHEAKHFGRGNASSSGRDLTLSSMIAALLGLVPDAIYWANLALSPFHLRLNQSDLNDQSL